MHTITLNLPPGVETAQLRKDLEEIIDEYRGKKVTYVGFPLPYAVGLMQMYEIPARGTVMTVTNDVNMFREERLHLPGGSLWYNAKIILMGFNENTLYFQQLKERFEYLNTQYERE
ncbi:MAG TPA: hypothetical protein VJB13_01275 [Candidatus Nanoarchaeia archaeon]|nr:hypothetical protein [Candidatus Nanoarchaeia archaeon]